MKNKQLVPALMLVLLLGALAWLIYARFDESMTKNEWSKLVVGSPAVLLEAEEVITAAEAALAANPGNGEEEPSEDRAELVQLVEQTNQAALEFAGILDFSEAAEVVDQGPLADKLDPFSLSAALDTEELVAVVPEDFQDKLAFYRDVKKELDVLMGQTERLTAQIVGGAAV